MGNRDIKIVAVIGAGIMGQGIAQNFAQAGLDVRVVDVDPNSFERCKQGIKNNLNAFNDFALLSEPVDTILERVSFYDATDIKGYTADLDFLVEAMPEILELKQAFYAKLDHLPAHVILASNTSSMTVSTIAEGLNTPERVIGLHYFNPAHIIPAVEVHTGEATSADCIEDTLAFMKAVGKQPVLVRKAMPGFIINRLTGAMEREIDYLLEEGVVSPEDLDIAVKASYGFRLACLGPMEAEDMIGLDTAHRAGGNIFPTLSNATLSSPLLAEKVERGELGIKSGKGWFDYPEDKKAAIVDENNRRLLRQLKLFSSYQ